jgi:hypothetical protein
LQEKKKEKKNLLMKNKSAYIFLIIAFLFLSSCNDNALQVLNKELSSADNIKIYFYDKTTGKLPGSGSVVSINNAEEVKHFLSAITDMDFDKKNCRDLGIIEFFKGEQSLMNMQFNYEPDCSFVVFKAKDVMQVKKINEDGIKLLNFYYDKIKK